jgi:hypothetical protein
LGRRKSEAFEVASLVVGQDGPESVFGELQHFFSDEILVFNGGVVTTLAHGGIQLGERPVRVIKEYRDSVVVNTGEEVSGRMGDVTDRGFQVWRSMHRESEFIPRGAGVEEGTRLLH